MMSFEQCNDRPELRLDAAAASTTQNCFGTSIHPYNKLNQPAIRLGGRESRARGYVGGGMPEYEGSRGNEVEPGASTHVVGVFPSPKGPSNPEATC